MTTSESHSSPIDGHCDRLRLSIDERLNLFLGVCDAVQYAHRNLVVHRDLKPANILVSGEGEPKLLDFGIAKVIEPTESPHAIEPTVGNQRLLTPSYASPEQILGNVITTATDVYSLGVVLYELLTGLKPYGAQTKTRGELERAVCEHEPLRPSTAVVRTTEDQISDKASLRRRLRGDLDTIVQMAMRKEPARRYTSVEQFAQDIRRHLDGRTVVARADTLLYRTTRFVRRNRVPVAAGVAVAMALVIGLVGSVTQWQRAEGAFDEEARQRAETESEAYLSSINAAESALRVGDVAGAADSLERAPKRLHGWEWTHLAHRLDRSLAVFTHPKAGGFSCIALSPDEQTLLAGDYAGIVHVSTSRRESSSGPSVAGGVKSDHWPFHRMAWSSQPDPVNGSAGAAAKARSACGTSPQAS